MGIGNKIKRLIGAALCAVGMLAAAAQAECRNDVVTLSGPFGSVDFSVEIADTFASRAQGLMHREYLPAQSGMLFVYPEERAVSFWMKNTLIPLDMIFITARGVVRRVHSNAVPGDLTSIPSGGPALAVLEINGGLANEIGITAGALVRHPALPQDRAVLPC